MNSLDLIKELYRKEKFYRGLYDEVHYEPDKDLANLLHNAAATLQKYEERIDH
jgi:hypothetical protein